MTEKKIKDPDSSTDKRSFAIPQGYSWYGISSGHSLSAKNLRKGSIVKDLFFGFITILGVILILLILF